MPMTQATLVPRPAPLPDPPPTRLAPPGLSVHAAGLSDRGLVRESNQDQFLIAELTKALHVQHSSMQRPGVHYSDERGHLFLVADGVGGRTGGEQASALAVGTIEDLALNSLRWLFALPGAEEHQVLQEFQAALRRVDARVFEEAAQRPELRGMGTTLTLAYGLGRQLYVAHVGDTRCYLLRGGRLHQITRDHTLVGKLVADGAIRREEATSHYLRHVITNVVGGSEPGLQAEAHKVELEPADVMLLCSDGLTEMLDEATTGQILLAEPEPLRACRALIATANARGGRDNVTVVVARFDAPLGYPKKPPPRNEPPPPARTPVSRPPEVRIDVRPKPEGRARPTPLAPPMVRPEKAVGRATGE